MMIQLLYNQLPLNMVLQINIEMLTQISKFLFIDGKISWIMIVLFSSYILYTKFLKGEIIETIKQKTIKKIGINDKSDFESNLINHLSMANSTIFNDEYDKTYIFQTLSILITNELHSLNDGKTLIKSVDIYNAIDRVRQTFKNMLVIKYGNCSGELLFEYIYPTISTKLKPVTSMTYCIFTELEKNGNYTNYEVFLIVNGMLTSILSSMIQIFDEFNGKIKQIIENGNKKL